MADRLTLIMELGALATDAAQRGDDRAAQTLRSAAERLFADTSAVDYMDRHRRRDRERKTELRGIPRKSTESDDFQGRPLGFSPTPPFPTPPETQHNTAREAISEDAELFKQYAGLLSLAMGEGPFRDADAFVRRRPSDTWLGWFREMLALIGPGSQYVAADLAQVCRDDTALDRKIASPKGLRVFLGSARAERIAIAAGSGSNGAAAGKEHWTDRKAREDHETGEWRLLTQSVETRRARSIDGDIWWGRMHRDSGQTGADLYRYAAKHLSEPGQMGETA
ncbi:MAG: hypothetical protein V4529_16760 [Gemmatimonadota bacterium]